MLQITRTLTYERTCEPEEPAAINPKDDGELSTVCTILTSVRESRKNLLPSILRTTVSI